MILFVFYNKMREGLTCRNSRFASFVSGEAAINRDKPIPLKEPQMPNVFAGPELKLKRANHHVSDLCRLVDSHLRGARVVVRSEPGRRGLRVEKLKPVSEDVPLLIGDAVHNLRSALDLLAVAAVGAAHGNQHRVYFPFAANADELDNQIRKKNIHRAGISIVDIIKSLQPYEGGNDTLRSIHDLDIIDKHNLIITTLSSSAIQTVNLRQIDPFAPDITFENLRFSGIGSPGGPTGLIRWDTPLTEIANQRAGGFNDGTEIPTTFTLVFGPEQPLAFEPVIAKLQQMASLVQEIIDRFADWANHLSAAP